MNEYIGIIDLGSNTTRLIVMVYTRQPSTFRLMDEVRETVRLASDIDEEGRLNQAAMNRSIGALAMFSALCRGTNVENVVTVGTSAIRDATNQAEFLERLEREAGLTMRILSGEEEAYYGYLGVINSTTLTDGFVLDIGGGSTEITHVRDRRFQEAISRPVGTVRFSERYIHTDPISSKEYRQLQRGVRDSFNDLDWFRDKPGQMLVGVGGTVRNLARVDQKRKGYPLERLHGYVMSRVSLEETIDTLRKSKKAEREAIPGLNSDRADVIVAGAVILHQAMLQANFTELVVSGQGLREGLFYEHFLQDQEYPLIDDVRRFSVYNLVQHYHYEPRHVEKVRELSQSLFDQTQPLHGYGAWERELLGAAAILHDIGVQVAYYDHHKHSAYLLLNTGLPGYTPREIALLTILVRSHRKGDIKVDEYQSVLEPDDDIRALRLGAILRLGEFLERSKSQAVGNVHIEYEGNLIRINISANGDATAEIWNALRHTKLFSKAFGRDVEIVPVAG